MKKNLRRCSHSALIILLCLAVSGCGSEWKRKFVRKRAKSQPDQVFVYEPKEYQKSPNDELYKKYYVFWRAWMEELINRLGRNKLADLRAFEEARKDMEEMQDCLNDEMASLLGAYIKKLEGYHAAYKDGDYDIVRSHQMAQDLNRMMLKMDKVFRYRRVQAFIKREAPEDSSQAAEKEEKAK